jgi:PAS domain S-box-containing protein
VSWLDRRPAGDGSQDILRELVERHPAGVLVVGDDGRVLAASATLRRLFGESPQGSNALALDPAAWASDPDRFRKRVAQIVADRRSVMSEEVLLADGRAFERDYARISLPGGAGAHMWEYRDITERRKADMARRETNARLLFLVNAGTAVLYSSRPGGDYDRTFVSDNIGELLGYDPSCWLTPGFWRRTLHPDDAARVMAEMARLRERGCQAMEYRMRHADGHPVWVHDELRQICEVEGQAVEIVGCLIDISTRRRSENDLTALGRVAADVGHDFRNLLLVVTGHACLLKRALDEEHELRWNVDEIAKASERAASLTDRLLSADPRAAAEPTIPVLPVARAAAGGETVLVVEDEDAVRVFTGRALAGSGYTVLEAKRAEEALEIVSQYPGQISALLTDVSMPGMSGCELAQKLALTRPALKVILMSGYDAADPVLGSIASSLSFLQKPFTPDVLATKLREVLDGKTNSH